MRPAPSTRSFFGACAGRGLLLAGLLLGLAAGRPAAGQTVPADTARVRYSEETSPTPPTPTAGTFKRNYSHLVRLQIDEQRLWKLGLNNLDFDNSTEFETHDLYGLHLIIEQKLRKAPWAVLAELSPALVRYRALMTSEDWQTSFTVNAQVAGRYYYNLQNRIRKGKSANNFSANYLSLALGGSAGRRSYDTPFNSYPNAGAAVRFDGAVLYGLQRRLGRYGFVDFNFGIPFQLFAGRGTRFSDAEGGPVVNLRIGLALGR